MVMVDDCGWKKKRPMGTGLSLHGHKWRPDEQTIGHVKDHSQNMGGSQEHI